MNLGYRDVVCLRRVLGNARERGSDIGAVHVLRRYERERRSENMLAARGLDVIGRVFDSTSVPLAQLRGLGLTVANKTPFRSLLARGAAGDL
jgi:2-octaprenyl-3-methyl-6-methoxy-1,4-benzoquinol hydroxylase/2-octaprenylphenol hydroxylase